MKLLSFLLLSLFFVASSNGQGKPNTISRGQLKMIRNHGSGPADNVHCGLLDKAGNLWFGTTGGGVYHYDGRSFTNFTTKDGLNSNDILCILEDVAGNIWFGTKNGLCRYDGKTFTDIPIVVTNGSNLSPYTSLSNNPSAKKAVWSMLQDKTGKFWFGTFDSGVYCYDGRYFTHFLDNDGVINNSDLHPTWVESILEDKSGNIWLGGRSWNKLGVCRFDGRSIVNFKPDDEHWLRPLLQDRNGNIWFGSRNHAMYRYDGKTFTGFGENEILDWVFSMVEDKAGNIWFSVRGKEGGVSRFDGRSITGFTTKDGLCSNLVRCIVQDRAGNLWFGTGNAGLCRYDGKTFTNFTK